MNIMNKFDLFHCKKTNNLNCYKQFIWVTSFNTTVVSEVLFSNYNLSEHLIFEHLSDWNMEMKEVVEPGNFLLMIGKSSSDIVLRKNFVVE